MSRHASQGSRSSAAAGCTLTVKVGALPSELLMLMPTLAVWLLFLPLAVAEAVTVAVGLGAAVALAACAATSAGVGASVGFGGGELPVAPAVGPAVGLPLLPLLGAAVGELPVGAADGWSPVGLLVGLSVGLPEELGGAVGSCALAAGSSASCATTRSRRMAHPDLFMGMP